MAKIRQTVEVEVEPTPCDLAQVIWEMDAEEQLDLLFALMEVDSPAKIYMQMQNIRDELDCCALDETDKRAVKRFVAMFHEFMCGED